MTVFVLFGWAVTVPSAIICLLTFFAKKEQMGEASVVTLFGYEITRAEYGPWQAVSTSRINPGQEAWSWIALDHQRKDDHYKAYEVLEFALWNLITQNKVALQSRVERFTAFNKTCEEESLYLTIVNAATITGSWENKIMAQTQATPKLIFDVLCDAFGSSSTNPDHDIFELVRGDFVQNGWGKYTGKIIPTFQWQVVNLPDTYSQIRDYIQSHPNLFPKIERAARTTIKNRTNES